jgi:hypothetical protein
MAFVLIDGVIANDTFSAPATPTGQPVDGILGLAWIATSGGATNYSLTCATGSYAVTGQAATFALAKKLTAATGSYAVAGKNATFVLARNLNATAGSYLLAGGSASFVYAKNLNAGAGVYNYSGQVASLDYVPGTPVNHYTLACVSGYYGINPMTASLVYKPSNITYQPYHFNYAPGPTPNLDRDLLSYVNNELLKVQGALYELQERHLETAYSVPARPREGDIRFADGIKWNPASGIGVYYYNGTLWKSLG